VPLIANTTLRKGASPVSIVLRPDQSMKSVDFYLERNRGAADVRGETVRRSNATCPVCDYTTPPTPLRASSSVICPSESSCTCWSFSSRVIWARSRSTRPSIPRSAVPRVGCKAASSRDCVAAITPPATIRLIATTVAASAVVRLRGP
jgi:hypothetical protein